MIVMIFFWYKESCNNESADGRSDSGSQVHYHKGTADQSYPESSVAGLGEKEATLHSSTTGTPVAEGQRQRKQRRPAPLHTPPADHASPSHPPSADNATVQRVCGNKGVHTQASSDHAASSDTHSGARSASGSDNSDCHVAGTLRGTSRPHDDTGSDNSDCHVAGTLRGTSRPHITDSTRGEGPVLLCDATTVWKISSDNTLQPLPSSSCP